MFKLFFWMHYPQCSLAFYVVGVVMSISWALSAIGCNGIILSAVELPSFYLYLSGRIKRVLLILGLLPIGCLNVILLNVEKNRQCASHGNSMTIQGCGSPMRQQLYHSYGFICTASSRVGYGYRSSHGTISVDGKGYIHIASYSVLEIVYFVCNKIMQRLIPSFESWRYIISPLKADYSVGLYLSLG